MIDEKKTDAEFIAECEAILPEDRRPEIWAGGEDVNFVCELAEAIERLKRLDFGTTCKKCSKELWIFCPKCESNRAYPHFREMEKAEIAELKSLLAWLWDTALEHPDVLADSPEKQRIEEILKENDK